MVHVGVKLGLAYALSVGLHGCAGAGLRQQVQQELAASSTSGTLTGCSTMTLYNWGGFTVGSSTLNAVTGDCAQYVWAGGLDIRQSITVNLAESLQNSVNSAYPGTSCFQDGTQFNLWVNPAGGASGSEREASPTYVIDEMGANCTVSLSGTVDGMSLSTGFGNFDNNPNGENLPSGFDWTFPPCCTSNQPVCNPNPTLNLYNSEPGQFVEYYGQPCQIDCIPCVSTGAWVQIGSGVQSIQYSVSVTTSSSSTDATSITTTQQYSANVALSFKGQSASASYSDTNQQTVSLTYQQSTSKTTTTTETVQCSGAYQQWVVTNTFDLSGIIIPPNPPLIQGQITPNAPAATFATNNIQCTPVDAPPLCPLDYCQNSTNCSCCTSMAWAASTPDFVSLC